MSKKAGYKMKAESKQDLRDRIEQLEQQIAQRDAAEREAKMQEWKKFLPQACHCARNELNNRIPGQWRLLVLDHIEESGFYFSYELNEGGNRWPRQSLRISHAETKEK